MDFKDKANQESYSSNFIKPSLKKSIDIHFYDKLHYYCVVFFMNLLCKQYNPSF